MKLDQLTTGRDNNFNLLRMLAATLVLITHSYALVTGNADAEPLRTEFNLTLGSMSVDIFFVSSGFLVTTSIFRSKSIIEFAISRIFRIYPALLVMLGLTVFMLGPIVSSLDWHSYFSSKETYKYLLKCATLLSGVAFNLPGVFLNNPWSGAVNGSLWTMPNEIWMYIILGGLWFLSKIFRQANESLLLALVKILHLTAFASLSVLIVAQKSTPDSIWLGYMFIAGASLYGLAHKIHIGIISTNLVLLVLLLLAWNHSQFFRIAYLALVPYAVISIAYINIPWLKKYNYIGDYSYGTYIYAFPIQQVLIYRFSELSIFSMILLSATLTVIASMISWHLIEKPALARRRIAIDWVTDRWPIIHTGSGPAQSE